MGPTSVVTKENQTRRIDFSPFLWSLSFRVAEIPSCMIDQVPHGLTAAKETNFGGNPEGYCLEKMHHNTLRLNKKNNKHQKHFTVNRAGHDSCRLFLQKHILLDKECETGYILA
jgi:hypothetical protein